MNDKITENFRWNEFFKSQTAIRHGIINYPTKAEEYNNIESLTKQILQPVRDKFGGIRITSGYRSKKLNSIIGGSIYSNHCKGQAADFEPIEYGISMLEIVLWIYNNHDFRELICEYWPEGWIHVAYRENGNNRQLKIKDHAHNYDLVSVETLSNEYSGVM